MTAGPTLAASLEPLTHHRTVDSLSLFIRYYFGRCSTEMAAMFLILVGRALVSLSVTIHRYYKKDYVSSIFLAQLGSGILCL